MHHLASVTWNWCTRATHKHRWGKVPYAKVQFHTRAHIFPSVLACTYIRFLSCTERSSPTYDCFRILFFSSPFTHFISPFRIPSTTYASLDSPVLWPPNFRHHHHTHTHTCTQTRTEYISDQVSPLTCTYTCLESPTSFPFLSSPNPPLLLPFHLYTPSSFTLSHQANPLPPPKLYHSALCWKDSDVPCNFALEGPLKY